MSKPAFVVYPIRVHLREPGRLAPRIDQLAKTARMRASASAQARRTLIRQRSAGQTFSCSTAFARASASSRASTKPSHVSFAPDGRCAPSSGRACSTACVVFSLQRPRMLDDANADVPAVGHRYPEPPDRLPQGFAAIPGVDRAQAHWSPVRVDELQRRAPLRGFLIGGRPERVYSRRRYRMSATVSAVATARNTKIIVVTTCSPIVPRPQSAQAILAHLRLNDLGSCSARSPASR